MTVLDFEALVRSTFPHFVWANVARRAKEGKDARWVRRLRGDDNPRQAVINAAAAKLMTSSYWQLNPDERDALADSALHNERQTYVYQTERLSRPRKPKPQKRPPKMFDVTPSTMSAESDLADKMAIAWRAKLRHEIAVELIKLKNRKHRRAALMLLKDQTLRDYQIAKKFGIAALTVSTFRKKLEALQAANTPSEYDAQDDDTSIVNDTAVLALDHAKSQKDEREAADKAHDQKPTREHEVLARGHEHHKWTPHDEVFAARKRQLKTVKRKSISTAVIEALADKFGLALQQVIDSATVREALLRAEIDTLKQALLSAHLSAGTVQTFATQAAPLCEAVGIDTDSMLSSVIGEHPERPSNLLKLFELFSGPEDEDDALA